MLHPGQTAGIYHENQKLGVLGALHPNVLQALDMTDKVYVFELDLASLRGSTANNALPRYPNFPKSDAILPFW